MSRNTFTEWLNELRRIVRDQYEIELEEMPEFDSSDAKAYYKEKSSPSVYFKECLSEYGEDGVTVQETFTFPPL